MVVFGDLVPIGSVRRNSIATWNGNDNTALTSSPTKGRQKHHPERAGTFPDVRAQTPGDNYWYGYCSERSKLLINII